MDGAPREQSNGRKTGVWSILLRRARSTLNAFDLLVTGRDSARLRGREGVAAPKLRPCRSGCCSWAKHDRRSSGCAVLRQRARNGNEARRIAGWARDWVGRCTACSGSAGESSFACVCACPPYSGRYKVSGVGIVAKSKRSVDSLYCETKLKSLCPSLAITRALQPCLTQDLAPTSASRMASRSSNYEYDRAFGPRSWRAPKTIIFDYRDPRSASGLEVGTASEPS